MSSQLIEGEDEFVQLNILEMLKDKEEFLKNLAEFYDVTQNAIVIFDVSNP